MNEVEYILRVILRARDEMAATFAKAATQMRAFGDQARANHAHIDGLNSKITSLTRRLGNLNNRLDEAGLAFKRFASSKRGGDKDLESNVHLFHGLATAVGHMAQRMDAAEREIKGHGEEQRRLGKALQDTERDADKAEQGVSRLERRMRHGRISVAGFDNQLRGIAWVSAAAFAQQLVTVLIGLVGQLGALASSAAFAGAALGGMLVAGIAQAIPAVGLLVGAMARVKQVMQAVQAAQLAQKAAFKQGEKTDQTAADNADSIANAQDSLRNAMESVTQAHQRQREAVRNLDAAREKAKRDLQDMIIAEKQAELAAKGATLSQKEAQEALRIAVQTGQGDLDIQRAQLGVQEANVNVTKAHTDAVRQHVDTRRALAGSTAPGMPAGDVADAKRQLEDANRAAADAARSVTRAQRGLEAARRNAAEAIKGTQTAAANLNFLLSQLSPAERRLYTVMREIQHQWNTTWRSITDIIIDSFTRTARRVLVLMQMPAVLGEARKLARSIAGSFNRITDAFTSQPMIRQFLRIAEAGRRNLRPLTDIVINLGKSFANIAEAAGPALHTFLGFLRDLSKQFLGVTGRRKSLTDFFNEGEKHFEAWIKLGLAVIRLFLALAGAGGAKAGMESVKDATKSINDATKWVDHHRKQVAKFFEDSRKVTKEVLGVIVALGKELAKSFDPKHVHNLAELLKRIVIPALGDAMRFLGQITDFLAGMANHPFFATFAKFAIEFALIGYAFKRVGGGLFQSIFGVFDPATEKRVGGLVNRIKDLHGSIKGLPGRFKEVGGQIKDFAGKAAPLVNKAKEVGGRIATGIGEGASSMLGRMAPFFTRLAPIVTRAATVIRAAASLAFGPWGLAIMAVIGIIILLDRRFHFLGPTFKWLKGAAKDVLDWLKHHWPLILTIMTGPFGVIVTLIVKHWGGIKHAFRDGVNTIKRIFNSVVDWIGGAAHDVVNKLSGILPKGFKKAGRDAANGLWDGIKWIGHFFADIGTWLFNHVIKPIYKFFEISSPSAYFQRIGKMLVQGLVNGFMALPNLLWGALKAMGDEIRKIGGELGKLIRQGLEKVPGGKLLLSVAGKAKALFDKVNPFAEGGPVPGSGDGDSVPALLTPGEYVLRKSVVGRVGIAFLDWLNGGRGDSGPGYQTGGVARHAQSASLVISFDGGDMGSYRSDWRNFWADIVRLARQGDARVEREFDQMRRYTTQDVNQMATRIRRTLVGLTDTFATRGKAMSNNWSDTWTSISRATYRGLNYIATQFNKAMKALGEKQVNFGLQQPRGGGGGDGGGNRQATAADVNAATGAAATGGFIGAQGQRGRDVGAYALGAGEAVLNWAHQRYVEPAMHAFYGHGLNAMFGRVRGFHAGGPGQPGFATGRVGNIVPIPGQPGESINRAILGDVLKLIRLYKLKVYDGWAPMGTHAPNSDHHWGGAVDVGPGPGGSWDLVDKLAHWAEPSQDHPRFPFRWVGYNGDAGHGRGNHLHLSWIHGAHLKGVPELMRKIRRPIITGGGVIAGLAQAAIDLLRGRANRRLQAAAYAGGDDPHGPIPNIGPGGRNIFKFFRQHGFTDEQAAGFVGNFMQESSLDPTRVQPNGQGHGLAQWGGGRFTALENFAKAAKKRWQDMGVQLAFVLHELAGPERAAGQAIHAAKTLEEAVDAIGLKYERYGIRGDRYGPAKLAFRKFAGEFAAGGQIPGPDGAPMPILAHAGEWIVNKLQQSRLAGLLGTSPAALRSLLGFHGGPGSAQGGAEVHIGTAAHARRTARRASDVAVDIYALNELFTELHRQLGRIRHFRITGTKKFNNFVDALNDLTKDQGVFDLLRQAIDLRVTQRARRFVNQQFRALGRGVIRQRTGFGPVAQADQQLADLRANRRDLFQEQEDITAALRAARRAVRRHPGSDRLRAQLNNLRQRQEDARQRLSDNTVAVFEQEQTALQARIDRITQRADRSSAFIDFSRRIATAVGDQGTLAKLNAAQRGVLEREANQLQGQLNRARRIGARDQVNALTQQIADIRTQIFESIQQQLRDETDQINQNAQRTLTGLDVTRRILTALGRSTTDIDNARIAAMRTQTSLLTAEMNKAAAAGNQGLAREISDQIADLNASIVEATQQMAQDAIDNVNKAATRRLGQLDLIGRMLDASGVVGQTAAGAAGLSRQGIFAARGTALETQRAGLQQILANQQRLPANQQNLQLIQDLTDQLAELDVTIKENTKAAFQARVEDVNTRSGYALTINDLNKQIIELTGQISGNTDQAGLLTLAQNNQAILIQKGNDLQALLDEAIRNQDQQAQQDLTQAILENKIALLQNTQTINELSGALTGPQTFTSSAWRLFREAIFTGMGEVLPQYQFPMAQTGGIAATAGLYRLHPGELIKPAGTWETHQGDIITNVYEAGRPIDTTEVSSAIAFARKNMQ